ncbi:hypothetical protein LEMLEM_LOCUS26536 [Lemmus lemmus]
MAEKGHREVLREQQRLQKESVATIWSLQKLVGFQEKVSHCR